MARYKYSFRVMKGARDVREVACGKTKVSMRGAVENGHAAAMLMMMENEWCLDGQELCYEVGKVRPEPSLKRLGEMYIERVREEYAKMMAKLEEDGVVAEGL